MAQQSKKKDVITENVKLINRASFLVRSVQNPVRQKLLRQIMREGEVPVHALVSRQQQEQSIVSQHLGILREAQLVRTRRDGKLIYYSLNLRNFKRLVKLIQQISADK